MPRTGSPQLSTKETQSMEQFAGALVSLAVFGAIVYSLARATLAPIHAKLDRLLAQQERLLGGDVSSLAHQRADQGPV